MKSPFVLRPRISRVEVLVILLATFLYVSYECLWDARENRIMFMGTWNFLASLPGQTEQDFRDLSYQWQSGDGEAMGDLLLAMFWGYNYALLFAFNATMPAWIWVRPGWRMYLWDALGALNLVSAATTGYYIYKNIADGSVLEGCDFYFYYSWMGTLANLAGAVCFGHFARLLWPQASQPRSAP